MALRQGDAIGYLRIKQNLKPSDCNAVIEVRPGCFELYPVFFNEVNGKRQHIIEIDEQMFVAESYPGFRRFEKIPVEAEPVTEQQTVSTEPAKLAGSTWAETRQNAEEQARQTLTEQQAARRASNGIGITSNKWQAFSDAAYRARNNK
jgi:hypothetical protein